MLDNKSLQVNLLSASREFVEQLAKIEDFLMDAAQDKDALAIIKSLDLAIFFIHDEQKLIDYCKTYSTHAKIIPVDIFTSSKFSFTRDKKIQ